jgi:transcriptional regulator of acetoin/glycerol metabolism
VERATLLAAGPRIRADELGLLAAQGRSENLEALSLEEVEQLLVKKALQRHEGNVSRAAETLGLSRSALYRRMEKFNL